MWCPTNASIPQGDRLVMNQAIDQLVNEIYEIVQAAWLGVGLRGMGQRRAREDVFQAGWLGHWPFAHRGCWC